MDKKTFLSYLPKTKHSLITDKFINDVNKVSDPDLRDSFRENLFRFSDLWGEFPRVGIVGFAEAVLFCSYRLVGLNLTESWKRTFPQRYKERMMGENGQKVVNRCAEAYGRRPIVVRIMERSLIPIHIINADIHQEAINTQAHLMRTAKSENVRMKAAECLIIALKPPEESVLNVKIEHRVDLLDELKETTRLLAQQQRDAIINGRAHVRQIAESQLGSGDIIDVDSDSVQQ